MVFQSTIVQNRWRVTSYDALGRRVSRTVAGVTTNYLYDGVSPVAVNGSVMLQGQGLDDYFARVNNGVATSFLKDALGSTLALTDSNASATTNYSYGPYGNTSKWGSDDTPFQFTGRENDGAANLYYYRARYYNPTFRQFLSADPLGLSGGLNAYAYTNGNPVNEVDPLGLDGWAGLSGGVTAEEAEAEAAEAAGRMATATNAVVGAGGTVAVANTAAEYSSGVYYNFYTGEGGGYTSGSGGNGVACPSSDQGGLGRMLGGYIGFIMGPAENVGGPFVNRNLGIPGLPISVTEYLNGSGEVVGGAIGYGAGTGYTQTQTVTTLYPW